MKATAHFELELIQSNVRKVFTYTIYVGQRVHVYDFFNLFSFHENRTSNDFQSYLPLIS